METPERPRSEMMDIVQTVVAALNDVISSLRNEVQALGQGERDARKRLYLIMSSVVLLAALSVVGIGFNYHQGQDVKKVVNYISDCQNPKGKCKTEQNGLLADVIKNIGKLNFDSTTCVQKVPLADRTDEKIAACRKQYFGE